MANLNKVMLIGNLTRDPNLSYLPSSQTPVCEIGLAVNRRWTGQDGTQREEVTFVDCSAFGRQAETLAKYMKKGNPIFIEGRLKLDQWEGQDGSKRSKMRVVVESFQFLGGGQRSGGGEGGEGGYEGDAGGGGGGGYAPRQASGGGGGGQGRPPMRQQARPASRPAQQQPPAEMDAPAPDDLPPANQGDDIPF